MSIVKWSRRAIGLALLAALLGGCAFNGPQSTFSTAGPVAKTQLDLFMLTFWLAVVVFVIVAGALIYILRRYRRKASDGDSLPPQTHGNLVLEIAWTIIPVIFLVIIAVPTVRVIFQLEGRDSSNTEALEVVVTAYQWWWEFEYPELGITTANELRIPVGERIRLKLRSGDVIHSFWVPQLGGKNDNIPGQENEMWLLADEPGIYYGQCAELCLTAHAYMRFRVVAEDAAGFEGWVSAFQNAATQELASEPLVNQGAQLFQQKGCAGCHGVAGVSVGNSKMPNLTNFGLRTSLAAGVLENTPENLADWLRDPQAIKPGNYMPNLGLSNEEIAALVAYLQSLGKPDVQAQAYLGGLDGTR